MKVLVIVEKVSDGNYGCFMANGGGLSFGLTGAGKTAREAIESLYEARDLERECFAEEGKEFPEIEFSFKFDVGSLFDYYPLNVTSFAKYIGMNASLLRQYASGAKVPQARSLQKIREGIQKLMANLNDGLLIDRPAVQYA